MNIVVVLKMVPDIVEELEVAPDGRSLDVEFLRLIANESDERALEQGLTLKERRGGTLTVVAPQASEIDDVLFTALAKGADRVVKVTGTPATTRGLATAIGVALPTIPGLGAPDVVLTGCQAIDDLDGFVAPLLAEALGLPYVGLVGRIAVAPEANVATVMREYAGGVGGEFEIDLPAVIGVQGSESAPRYVPVAKVRAAMASGEIEEFPAPDFRVVTAPGVAAMARPEAGARAEMIEGSPGDVAEVLAGILAERGLL